MNQRKQRKPWPDRFWAKVDKSPSGPSGDCWTWIAGRDTNGYGQLRDTAGVLSMATHIMWELTYGSRPLKGVFLCHTCDNPPCVNPQHLFEGNAKLNAADMMAKGRRFVPPVSTRRRGIDHQLSKLTKDQVQEIRATYVPANRGARHATISQRILAKKYGVSKGTIQAIVGGVSWKHLT